MAASSSILRVAVPAHVRRSFDYQPPAGTQKLQSGCRLSVPFGKSGRRVGMLLGTQAQSAVPRERLKRVLEVIDEKPLIPASHLRFLLWAGDYYQHPVGEVVLGSLPLLLRRGGPARTRTVRSWRITPGQSAARSLSGRAFKQELALRLLAGHAGGVAETDLREKHGISRATLAALLAKGLVETVEAPPSETPGPSIAPVTLNEEQAEAVKQIAAVPGFHAFLLNGVTGSGKTEVYLELIRRAIAEGRQALVLVPEIGLTPQFIARVKSRIAEPVRVMHSGLAESERLDAWLAARDGRAAVILGTRSAIWTPLKHPGIFIVDEEHDLSYKQHEGFRYSARDLAVIRARDAEVAVVLGSATPSLESLHNASEGRYSEVRLERRHAQPIGTSVEFVDIRGAAMDGAFSERMLAAVQAELDQHRQVLLFLNRRGYSPVLMCHACGWTATCRRCDLPLTLHKQRNLLVCHHCGAEARPPAECGECATPHLQQIGHGTERLVETLSSRFPAARILRVDRDSTRRRGEMGRMVEAVNAGEADILVGTQMLAKGHHFPRLALVGIVDADRGLFSADFRAAERMAQLLVQVSGRAGREHSPGRVLIQTHHPDHPLLRTLISGGYREFARIALDERREAGLPPFSFLALVRAEHNDAARPERFLQDARRLIEEASTGVEVYGPYPAPMERKAGRFRAQLLLQSSQRGRLARALHQSVAGLEALPSARKVRWSLDIDPQDML